MTTKYEVELYDPDEHYEMCAEALREYMPGAEIHAFPPHGVVTREEGSGAFLGCQFLMETDWIVCILDGFALKKGLGFKSALGQEIAAKQVAACEEIAKFLGYSVILTYTAAYVAAEMALQADYKFLPRGRDLVSVYKVLGPDPKTKET